LLVQGGKTKRGQKGSRKKKQKRGSDILKPPVKSSRKKRGEACFDR